MKALMLNGNVLEYVPDELKLNKEIVSIAISQDGYALKYAPKEITKDKKFIESIVKKSNDIFLMRYINKGLFTGKELNSLSSNLFLRKKIQSDMTLKNYKYKMGINKDINIFNYDTNCSKGGMYFTNEKYVNDFSDQDYGSDIYEIKLPDDAQIFLEDYNKAKSNKIEIAKRISILQ